MPQVEDGEHAPSSGVTASLSAYARAMPSSSGALAAVERVQRAPSSDLEAQRRACGRAALEAHLVAEQQVVALVAVDRSLAEPPISRSSPSSPSMPVAAAVVVVARAHELQAVGQGARVAVDQRAVVAERDVVAAAEHERVLAGAAERDVAAAAGGDAVVAAERRRQRVDQAEDLRQRREREPVRGAVARGDLAVVAEHDVGTLAGVDRVGARRRR